MVLYHFPPGGGISMARNVRNVQYLPRFGWTPIVVAPRGAGELTDLDAMALVSSSTRLARAWSPEPRHLGRAVALARRVGRRPGRSGGRHGDVGTRSGVLANGRLDEPSGGGPPLTAGPSRLSRLRRLVFFPDDQIGWLPFAVFAALRAHQESPFDAIYSTSSPVSAHLVAGIIKKLTGVPWVAEFRDPWVGNPLAGPLPWFHRRLQRRMERWIVRSADRVVFLSPTTSLGYRRRYPDAAEMSVITNGHDASEMVTRPPAAPRSAPFRIVWTGTLYRPDELRVFLEALQNLAARRPGLVDRLEVVFYGEMEGSCRAIADHFLADAALDAIVSFPGFVPRRTALEAVAGSDAALVMLGAGRGMGQFVPGKLFDYIGQSKQVLAVLPPGDARAILRDLDWGVVADPVAPDIERAIEQLLNTSPPVRFADAAGKYDRITLAGRLADVLGEAIEGGSGGQPGRSREHSSPHVE